MKSFVSFVRAIGFCGARLTCGREPEKLTGSADRKCALYKVGEPITFSFLLTDDKDVPLRTRKFTIVGDSSVSQQVTLTTDAAGKAQFTTKLDKPGFVRCDRTTGVDKKMGVVGAGAEPEKILPAVPKPADFDEYWRKTVAELDAMTVEPKVVTLRRVRNRTYRSAKSKSRRPEANRCAATSRSRVARNGARCRRASICTAPVCTTRT